MPHGNRRARCPKANAISAQFLLNQNNRSRPHGGHRQQDQGDGAHGPRVPRHRQPRRASHAALLRWAAGTSLGGPRGGEEEGGREREKGQGTRQEEEEEDGKGQLDDP